MNFSAFPLSGAWCTPVSNLTVEKWESVLAEIAREISPGSFQTWFRNIELIAFEENIARLGVPNLFMKEWIREHYLPAINRALEAATGVRPEVALTISPRLFQATRQEQTQEMPAAAKPPATGRDAAGATPRMAGPGNSWGLRLNRRFTLDGFVVGAGSRLAYDAAHAVLDSASGYNPLFLHGGPGLGKTHLMQAIGSQVRQARPGASVLYLSCEEFTNGYIGSLQAGSLDAFRNRCRNADYLLVDDVHFLASKTHTQEEFFHTFNTLQDLGRQVVLSSDTHPRDIAGLTEKLRTRLVGGLVATIDAPDLATRLALVRAKAAAHRLELADDVAELVARRIQGNVRELEGAVTALLAASRMAGRPPDLAEARATLRRLVAMNDGPLSPADIIKAVESAFGVKEKELRSASRARRVLVPRQVGMYLSRRLTELSLSEVGRFFGGKDHATVLYAERRIEERMKKDPELRRKVEQLSSQLGD